MMLKKNDQAEGDAEQNQSGEEIRIESSQMSALPELEQTNGDNFAESNAAKTPKVRKLPLVIRAILQIILMTAIVTASFFAMKRLIDAKPEIRKRPSFRTVYTINTTPVVLGDNRPNFKVYGETVAARTVELRSLVTGEVIWINDKLKAGARIEKGENLVEIDDFQFKGSLREARANLEEAKARIRENESRINLEKAKMQRFKEQMEFAKTDHKRIQELRAKGTTTQKQLDDRAMILSQRMQAIEQSEINLQAENARLEQQKAGLARLNWRVELAEHNLENTTLKAPFGGIVTSANVETGKTVNANDIVVSLYENRKIEVRFTLTDNRFGRLQNDTDGVLGRNVNVIWAIGNQEYSYPAIIDRLGAEISSSSGGVEVFALLKPVEGNPELRPGAFVEIVVPDAIFAKSAIVPESAIYHGNTIYLKENGKLVSRKVNVHAHDSGNVIISGPFAGSESVLVTRIAEISDGLRVREEGAQPPPGKAVKKNSDKGKRGDKRTRKEN